MADAIIDVLIDSSNGYSVLLATYSQDDCSCGECVNVTIMKFLVSKLLSRAIPWDLSLSVTCSV